MEKGSQKSKFNLKVDQSTCTYLVSCARPRGVFRSLDYVAYCIDGNTY